MRRFKRIVLKLEIELKNKNMRILKNLSISVLNNELADQINQKSCERVICQRHVNAIEKKF